VLFPHIKIIRARTASIEFAKLSVTGDATEDGGQKRITLQGSGRISECGDGFQPSQFLGFHWNVAKTPLNVRCARD